MIWPSDSATRRALDAVEAPEQSAAVEVDDRVDDLAAVGGLSYLAADGVGRELRWLDQRQHEVPVAAVNPDRCARHEASALQAAALHPQARRSPVLAQGEHFGVLHGGLRVRRPCGGPGRGGDGPAGLVKGCSRGPQRVTGAAARSMQDSLAQRAAEAAALMGGVRASMRPCCVHQDAAGDQRCQRQVRPMGPRQPEADDPHAQGRDPKVVLAPMALAVVGVDEMLAENWPQRPPAPASACCSVCRVGRWPTRPWPGSATGRTQPERSRWPPRMGRRKERRGPSARTQVTRPSHLAATATWIAPGWDPR
jgi:hypothetical protein